MWDAAIKQRVGAAFAATGEPSAAAVFARVERVLDGQAAAWLALRAELCRGGGDPTARSLQAACLDDRRAELAVLTQRFVAADAELVRAAVHEAFELPTPEMCADVDVLRLSAPPPPSAARPPARPEVCALPPEGRFAPLDVGRVWVYDVIDKSTRRPAGDPKVLTVEALEPVGGCKPDVLAYRTRRQTQRGYALRWQEAREVPSPDGGRPGYVTVRHRDVWYTEDGTATKDEYYVPSRARLDESCGRVEEGASYLDTYDEVEVESSAACGEVVARETRTFDWKVLADDVPVTLELDYGHPACCAPDGTCAPPPDGPGHRCVHAEGSIWRCQFDALQVQRREVQGGKTATYWFALGVGKILEDTKGEERETLICFRTPTPAE